LVSVVALSGVDKERNHTPGEELTLLLYTTKVVTKSENNFSISFECIINTSLKNSYSVVESNYLLHTQFGLHSRENREQVNDIVAWPLKAVV
jgi:hypothetical protein